MYKQCIMVNHYNKNIFSHKMQCCNFRNDAQNNRRQIIFLSKTPQVCNPKNKHLWPL